MGCLDEDAEKFVASQSEITGQLYMIKMVVDTICNIYIGRDFAFVLRQRMAGNSKQTIAAPAT